MARGGFVGEGNLPRAVLNRRLRYAVARGSVSYRGVRANAKICDTPVWNKRRFATVGYASRAFDEAR
jgi:hypothetical protein